MCDTTRVSQDFRHAGTLYISKHWLSLLQGPGSKAGAGKATSKGYVELHGGSTRQVSLSTPLSILYPSSYMHGNEPHRLGFAMHAMTS